MGPSGIKQPDIPNLSPAALWKHFVARRLPVHIKRQLSDPEWRAFERWTDDYLVQRAGHAVVEVEQRSRQQGFGRGTKVSMQFEEFIRRAAAGDASVYLSTQEASIGPDGHLHLLSSPLAELAGDFPLRPALTGHLVPQAVNMWMGVAPQGASSGLHHDFHDNLYILLRGRKRFRMYPPSQARNMYTHGSVAWTHPNGRIVYKGQGDILADGTDAVEVQRWREHSHAQAAIAAAEAAVAAGKKGAKRQLAAAERQLEELLEAALDEVGSDGDMRDDYDDGDDDELDGGRSGVKRRKGANGVVVHDMQQIAAAAAAAAKGRPGKGPSRGPAPGTAAASAAAVAAEEPPNFSRVDLSLSGKQLKKQWPLFPGKQAAITVELNAGEMLYLPAGWFHEVTSVGDAAEGGHLAINYWFHPPDNLDCSEAGFNTPYTSDYLPSIWADRQAWLAREVAGAARRAPSQNAGKAAAQAAGAAAGAAAAPGKRPRAAAGRANGADAAAAGRPISAPVVVAKGSGGGGGGSRLHSLKLGERRVVWDEEVSTPPNKYRQSNTREGTASGSAARAPVLEQQDGPEAHEHRDQLVMMHRGGEQAHAGDARPAAAGGRGDGGVGQRMGHGAGGSSGKSGAGASGGAGSGVGGAEGGSEDGDGGADGDGGGGDGDVGPEDPEAARAAVSEWMKTQPNLAKLLFAQFLQAGGAGVLAGDDDSDDDDDDGNVGVMGGGTLQRVAVRIRRPPPGRRHHLFVSMRQVPRRRASQ